MNQVNDSLPPFDGSREFKLTAPLGPCWKFGDGVVDFGHCQSGSMIQIDPHSEARLTMDNYRLLTSAVIPRPIALMSTISADGSSINLAPFSYFTVVSHDPPIFVVGFAGGVPKARDSLRNLIETRECTINIISEDMLQAANACSLNAPYGVSEWDHSGLTQGTTTKIRTKRVAESPFSVEGTLIEVKEFESRIIPRTSNSAMAIIEGVNFWVWKRTGNEESAEMDVNVLRPVARLGGSTYARVLDGMNIARPKWQLPSQTK
ncbi:hypothetical protein CBER1_10576 [Cercospora berteroae]|uniref:Flavin reductase like domain-containing protein n=1 Tax=Cercospora berteroae TaxID=357750 RepID=A0A2S6BY68_9PEZI|nr:hypothetical protein CBER1_10576 [Cercospora berteroae]